MRVSEFYNLGRSQATLDFVDIDVVFDTPVFVSPKALTLLPSEFGAECVHLVQNFFQAVLDLIRDGQQDRAESLLSQLREPNDTRLGLSKGPARGQALGDGQAHTVWESISRSEAAKSGLLKDLEDTVLLIPKISIDKVSDMTTNIIRGPLIRYTQSMCDLYGIPTEPEIDSGPMWDSVDRKWFSAFVELPVAEGRRLLLVPKAIVRRHLQYNVGEYFRHYLLTHLQSIELTANSELVEVIRSGRGRKAKERRRVTKKALIEKYGSDKQTIVRETLKHPEVLERYRNAKRDDRHLPLTLNHMARIEDRPDPEWDDLLAAVTETPVGRESADRYEKAIEGLIGATFYPNLVFPIRQHEIHDGRKRIDVTYSNMGVSGFFKWLSAHYPSAMFFVECKNYGREVGNPELDQLAGRFSPSRGQVGLLVCRSFQNKEHFLKRCIDTARDQRGYVLPLDDSDLARLVAARRDDPDYPEWPLLRERFVRLLG